MLRDTSNAIVSELEPRAAQLPDVCQSYHCQLAGRLTCREAEDNSSAYECLSQTADTLQRQHRAAEVAVTQLKQDWFVYIEGKDTADRSDRRYFRRTKEKQFASFSADALVYVQRTLESQLEPGWDKSPLTLDGRKDFNSFFAQLDKTRPPKLKTNTPNRESIALFDTHFTLAIGQLKARGELAKFYNEAPDEARTLFHPDNWENLSPPLQHLAAIDISKGDASVILKYQFNDEPNGSSENSPGDRLTQYLSTNGVSKETKAFFKAVQIGAAATGANTCPFNEFGLCQQVLDRIDMSQLPPQILADIERREQFGQRSEKARLEQLAKSIPLGLFNPKANTLEFIEMQPDSKSNGHKRKKQSVETSPTSHEDVTNPEVRGDCSKLQVQLLDGLTATIDSSDGRTLDYALDQLLETKLVTEYMEKHNFKGMNDFMRNCLAAIMDSDSQRAGSGIKALTDAQPIYHDGAKLRIYELAVDKHQGLQGNRVARHTRIFFAKGSSEDTRKILLLSIAQKEDIKKDNLTRFFKRR